MPKENFATLHCQWANFGNCTFNKHRLIFITFWHAHSTFLVPSLWLWLTLFEIPVIGMTRSRLLITRESGYMQHYRSWKDLTLNSWQIKLALFRTITLHNRLFLQRDTMRKSSFAVARCPSVYMSVHHIGVLYPHRWRHRQTSFLAR